MALGKIILIFLLLQFSISYTEKKWTLDILDEEKKSNIILTPGKFTKIYFILTNKTEMTFPILEEYKLSFSDENILCLDNDIILIPKENLVYSTYIALKCGNSIMKNEYEVKINVIPNNQKTDDQSIEYNNLNVSINRKEFEIDLDILLHSMPKNSFNLFQLKEEPYNADEIRIKATQIEGFEFKDIIIKSFKEREKLWDKNSVNHGIIFDAPFGVIKPEENLKEKYISLKINLADDSFEQCYKLSIKEFEFSIEEEIPKINETFKKVIKYSFEDITEKYDNTINFKFKTIIPISPIMLTCSLEQKLVVPIQNATNKPTLIYKNVIPQSGDFIFEANDLEFNSEYFANCEFSDTNYLDNDRNKINITIGNRDNYDIIHQLKTTRESKRSPQCVKLSFDTEKISEFKEVGTFICKYFMKKDEPFKVRDLPTILCEIIEENKENVTICVSPSPKHNIEGNLKIFNNYNYNNSFNNFIEYVKKKFSANLENIEYDIKINNYISISYTGMQMTNYWVNIKFNVSSNNTQTIQCFYNSELTTNNSRSSDYNTSIILSPKENNFFNIYTNWEGDNKTLSFHLKCYNLPNFIYKYESYNYGTIYTYFNTDIRFLFSNIKIKSDIIKNISINCNEKKNQINPICMKKEKISINEIIKTDLPEFLREVEDNVEHFSKMAEILKFYYLKILIENYPNQINFDPKEIKNYLEKSIELLKHLSSIDCTHYFYIMTDNETEIEENYTKCRNNKKEGMKPIINFLKTVISFSNNITFIISNIEGKDLEENLKYILIFLKELTNNEDSYENEWSSIVTKFAIMLQEQFDYYWQKVYTQLYNDKNYLIYIEEVKKEIILSIFEILTSIPRIIHYGEFD